MSIPFEWIERAVKGLWFSGKCLLTAHRDIHQTMVNLEVEITERREADAVLLDKLNEAHNEAKEGRKELHSKIDKLMMHLIPGPTGAQE